MKLSILLLVFATFASTFFAFKSVAPEFEEDIIFYIADPSSQQVALYWKDSAAIFGSLGNLKTHLDAQGKALLFATNAGMYMQDQTPLGLFIENNEVRRKTNSVAQAYGNFYLQPNGIFYITNSDSAVVCKTVDFRANKNIKYATQSGPMLLIDGQTHPALTEGSKNLHIRNGVGILPEGKILFAMSKKRINFFDFASFFKSKGCENALYLDGFVSRTYLPEKEWIQTDGKFGVIIGVTNK